MAGHDFRRSCISSVVNPVCRGSRWLWQLGEKPRNFYEVFVESGPSLDTEVFMYVQVQKATWKSPIRFSGPM